MKVMDTEQMAACEKSGLLDIPQVLEAFMSR